MGQFRTSPVIGPGRPRLRDTSNDLAGSYRPPKDNGCEYSPKCIDCPLPACKHDFRGGIRSVLNQMVRDPEIVRLTKEGAFGEELAIFFQVSLRTVRRVLAEARNGN